MIAAGALPAHRLGRLQRIAEDDLLVFLLHRRAWAPVSSIVQQSQSIGQHS
jgi:hypothetical protein